MSLVLDTAFLVDVARRSPAAVDLLRTLDAEAALLLVPSVVLAEYLAGFSDPSEAAAELRENAEVLDFSESDARSAAQIARAAIAAGHFPGWNDVLIAGFARNRGAEAVVTRNTRHFPGVKVRTY